MRMNRNLLLLAIVAAVATPARAVLAPDHVGGARYREGELLVKYRDAAGGVAARRLKSAYGLSPQMALLGGRMELVRLPSVMDVRGAVAALRGEPDVEYAEPNFIRYKRMVVPNDTLFGQQWGLRNTGQANFFSGGPAGTPGGDLNMVNAWDSTGTGVADRTGTGAVTIAILDDAVETTHPDLAANIVAGHNFITGGSDPNPTPGASPAEDHGTRVAGCAAAVGNNGLGVAGAAWNEKLMPLKFDFSTAQEVAALAYARDHGAKIVNGSFGGPSYTRAERDAIADLAANDILFVVAAGNENANTDFAGAEYPANYQFSSAGTPLDNLVAVAATNRQDDIASFSSYGPVTMPVAAPGLQIVTTAVGGTYTGPLGLPPDSGASGTSFSSPYVAGIAALIRDYIPAASATEVKARLIESGNPGLDSASPVNLRTAGGRVDAQQALGMAPRPAIVIEPIQTGSYQEDYGSGTETIPVLSPVAGGDGKVALLTAGQASDLRITLRNLWMPATLVQATLSADGGVTVNGGTQSYGSLAAGAAATQSFNVSIPAGFATGHHYVHFTLDISADGGLYTAQRHFIQEVGVLQDGVAQAQAIQTDLYDSFHTWRYDVGSLPAGSNALTFSTTAGNDIDILVRYGAPAQYDIELNADPAEVDPLYFTDPAVVIGGNSNGNESVTIRNPQPGSYYVTVVNFDQTAPAAYTLTASLGNTPPGSHGGGPVAPSVLLVLGAAGLLRRRRPK